jgi:hypothetical protein
MTANDISAPMKNDNLYTLFDSQLRVLAKECGYDLAIQLYQNLGLFIVAMPILSESYPDKNTFLSETQSLVNGKNRRAPRGSDALIITEKEQRIEIKFVK